MTPSSNVFPPCPSIPTLYQTPHAELQSNFSPKDLQLSSSRPQLGDKGPLIAVCGCTGTGKTKLGVELGHLLSGRAEVISADSMQIYQGLDVITNKASSEEMEGVKHHLMSFRHPCPPTRGDEYVVKNFVEDANALVCSIASFSGAPG